MVGSNAGEERGKEGKSPTSQGRKTPREVHLLTRQEWPGELETTGAGQRLAQHPISPKHRVATKWRTKRCIEAGTVLASIAASDPFSKQ